MISLCFGNTLLVLSALSYEVLLRLALYHANTRTFCCMPHYTPVKRRTNCQFYELYVSRFRHFSFPKCLFQHRNKKSSGLSLRDEGFPVILLRVLFSVPRIDISIPCHPRTEIMIRPLLCFLQEYHGSDCDSAMQIHRFSQ